MASKQSVPTVPPANPTGNAVQNNVPLLNWRTCSSRNVLAASTVASTEPLNNTVDGLNQLPDAAGALSKRKQCTHQEIQADALVNEAARQAKGGNVLGGAGTSAGAEPLSNTVDGLNQPSDVKVYMQLTLEMVQFTFYHHLWTSCIMHDLMSCTLPFSYLTCIFTYEAET